MNKSVFLKIIFLLLAIFSTLSCVTFYHKNNFDSEIWKAGPKSRFTMGQNIEKSKILTQKTKDEIISLLGNPDLIFDDNYFRYNLGYNFKSHNIFYRLKVFFSGEDVLDIYFVDDKVTKLVRRKSMYYPRKSFNKNDWDKYASTRFTMTWYLIDNAILIGKTKDEILDLLGTNESHITENRIIYDVGSSWMMDDDAFAVFFENGYVVKVMQYEP